MLKILHAYKNSHKCYSITVILGTSVTRGETRFYKVYLNIVPALLEEPAGATG